MKDAFTRIAAGLRQIAEGFELMAAHKGSLDTPGVMTTLEAVNRSTRVKMTAVSGAETIWGDDEVVDTPTVSRLFDGQTVKEDRVRGEWFGFGLVLESVSGAAETVQISLPQLATGGGDLIQNTGADVQDESTRPIQIFQSQYLPQDSTSFFGALLYRDDHQPRPLRSTGDPISWATRPKADSPNPAILQDVLINPNVVVPATGSMFIWVDVWIDPGQAVGNYTGAVIVTDAVADTLSQPVELNVRAPVMPGQNTTMNGAFALYGITGERFTGNRAPAVPSADHDTQQDVLDDLYRELRKHRLDPLGDDSRTNVTTAPTATPDAREFDRLLGNIFTAGNGYIGPGAGEQLKWRSIGTYFTWRLYAGMGDPQNPADDATNAAVIDAEFTASRAAEVAAGWTGEGFHYLIDEAQSAEGFALAEKFAGWSNFATHGYFPMSTYGLTTSPTVEDAAVDVPGVEMYAFAGHCAPTSFQAFVDTQRGAGKRMGPYNGIRPFQGSMQQAEEPLALQLNYAFHAQADFDFHFWWNAGYWRNDQGFNFTGVEPGTYDADKHPDFRETAHWFGDSQSGLDESIYGKRGFRRSLGDGVLAVPRTDSFFPAGVPGIAGVDPCRKLKHIREGIQFRELYNMAVAVDQPRAEAALLALLPTNGIKVGVANDGTPQQDRTYTNNGSFTDQITFDSWYEARVELMDTIEGI